MTYQYSLTNCIRRGSPLSSKRSSIKKFPLMDFQDPSLSLLEVSSKVNITPALQCEIRIPDNLAPQIENINASCELSRDLDLKTISFKIRNAEYNPRKCNAVILRLKTPKATIMIYSHGKLLVTGSKSENDALRSARKVCKLLNKCGYSDITLADFRIENIVASTDVLFPIRLEGIANEHRSYASYEPELFSGLVFRMFKPRLSILVFVTGKVVITGAKNIDEVYEAFQNLFPVLDKYRK